MVKYTHRLSDGKHNASGYGEEFRMAVFSKKKSVASSKVTREQFNEARKEYRKLYRVAIRKSIDVFLAFKQVNASFAGVDHMGSFIKPAYVTPTSVACHTKLKLASVERKYN